MDIINEAGLPASYVPVDRPPVNTQSFPTAPPLPNAMQYYFQGSISPALQHDVSFVGTQYGVPSVPNIALMPIGAAGSANTNAAVRSASTTSTIIEKVSAAGANGNIQFNSGGALGASTALSWDNVNDILTIGGNANISGSAIIVGSASASVFNASTGFQIGGTATLGKYLRGNGTDFVSATLSGSDIAAGVVGISFGGTGTSTPSLTAGNDIAITGSWPNNTIAVKTQSGVTAGSYTNTNLTVDAQGIITAVANGTGGSGATVPGVVNLSTQTANISASTLYATGVSGSGTYLVTIYLIISQAASVSSTLPDSQIIYTDQDSSAVITVPVTSGLTTNTTSTFAQASFVLNAKASTNIQYAVGQVSSYASSGATPMQFAYHARAVFLG